LTTDIQQQIAPSRLGQATAVEQSRAIAEVQAAIVVAQQCPRNVLRAIDDMRESCRRKELADRAFYRYPKGGKPVTGPTVHLARELARVWGNFQYGLSELRRDDDYGQSELLAFAWDVQTNTRNASVFINPHRLYTGGKGQLTELRDIYDNNANVGARRVREAIFAVLPTWFVEEAVDLCSKTIAEGGGVPLPQRKANAIEVFGNLGITIPQLEAKLGAPSDKWTDQDVAQLRIIRQSLMRGEVRKEEEFPAAGGVTAAEITQNVPSAEAPTPPAHAATPVPQSAEGAQTPGPAPSGHPAADEAAPGPGPAERASSGQRSILSKHLDRLGIDDPEERLGILSLLAHREDIDLGDLTPDEAKDADRRLKACKDRAALIALVHAEDLPEAGDG
jgi:hypothetical protein